MKIADNKNKKIGVNKMKKSMLNFFMFYCVFLFSLNLYGEEINYSRIRKPHTKLLPTSVTVNPQGEVFVVDAFTGTVVKYSNKWRYQFTLDIKGLKSIVDLFYFDNYIYALSGEGKIFRFDSNGVVDFYKEYERGHLLGQLSSPRGIYVDHDSIYISDSGNSRIQIFNRDGSLNTSFGYKTFGLSGFMFNTGISKIGDNLIVADTGSQEVKVFDRNGFYVSNLRDESGSEFIFTSPEEVFVDMDNHIYIVDSGTNQISIYLNDGRLIKLGRRGSSRQEFYGIKDIWVDDNYIYVADTLNEKIKIFDKNTYTFVRAIGASNFMKITSLLIIILILVLLVKILKRINKKNGEKEIA